MLRFSAFGARTTMKLQILSHLHTEFAEPPETDAEAVLLAGDIGVGATTLSGVKAATLLVAFTLALPATGVHAGPLAQAFDMRVPVSPVPVVISGTPRLVYELHLTNFSPDVLEPVSLEVQNAVTGDVLVRYADEALAERLQYPATAESSSRAGVPPGAIAIAYVELDVPEPPHALDHRLTFRLAGERAPPRAITGAWVQVSAEQPVVLGPPLRGGHWAAVYHPAWERGHRRVIYAVAGRAVIPGRFAIDWIRLDAGGQQADGDPDVVANWYGDGAEVLAVADAVVAAVRDDVAESETLSGHPDHPLEDATGNYVVLDLGGERYAFYEHLKPGSVRFAAGERVRRGEPIAALGFTGHSTGPHLHFHVADGPAPLGSEGLPFVIDAFEVGGRYEDIGSLGRSPWAPAEAASGGNRTAEHPAPNVVLRFP